MWAFPFLSYAINDNIRKDLHYSFSPCNPIQCRNTPNMAAVSISCIFCGPHLTLLWSSIAYHSLAFHVFIPGIYDVIEIKSILTWYNKFWCNIGQHWNSDTKRKERIWTSEREKDENRLLFSTCTFWHTVNISIQPPLFPQLTAITWFCYC